MHSGSSTGQDHFWSLLGRSPEGFYTGARLQDGVEVKGGWEEKKQEVREKAGQGDVLKDRLTSISGPAVSSARLSDDSAT